MGILNIFSKRAEHLIEKVIKIYIKRRKEGYPHDLSLDKILSKIYRDSERLSEVSTRFKFLSVWVATDGGFEEAFYGSKLNEIEGPIGELRDRLRSRDMKERSEEIKVIIDNLKTANFLERDLKILIFAIYDFKFPAYPTPELYKKRIKQINNVYASLSKYLQTVDMDPQTAFSVKKGGWAALETTINDLLREKYKEGSTPRGISREDPYKYLIPDDLNEDE